MTIAVNGSIFVVGDEIDADVLDVIAVSVAGR